MARCLLTDENMINKVAVEILFCFETYLISTYLLCFSTKGPEKKCVHVLDLMKMHFRLIPKILIAFSNNAFGMIKLLTVIPVQVYT